MLAWLPPLIETASSARASSVPSRISTLRVSSIRGVPVKKSRRASRSGCLPRVLVKDTAEAIEAEHLSGPEVRLDTFVRYV
jgi:hypothetical protein